ncbi:hypothetical protein [Microcoleus sp. AT3-D2]
MQAVFLLLNVLLLKPSFNRGVELVASCLDIVGAIGCWGDVAKTR